MLVQLCAILLFLWTPVSARILALVLQLYTVSQKNKTQKQDTKLLPITSPNIDRFTKFFTVRLSRKFVTKSHFNSPPRSKCVATLPCEISMFKKSQFLRSK